MKRLKLPILFGALLLAVAVIAPVLVKANSFRSPKASEVHVTLEWAAFDTDHAAVNYHVEGPFDVPDGYLPITCPVSKAQVFDASGNDLTGRVVTSCRIIGENKYSVTQFFYNDFRNSQPELLEVSVGDVVLMPAGSGEVSQLPLIGSYKFSGQFEQASDITTRPGAKAEQNGISLMVSRVDFTPHLIKVDACLTLPDTKDWIPDAYILMAGKRVQVDEWFIPNFREDPKIFESRERCYTFLAYTGVQDFRQLGAGTISFGVNEVYTNIPECVDAQGLEKIKAELEKHGFRPQLDQSGYYCFMSDIANSELDETNRASLFEYIQKTLPEHVHGPLEVVVR